MPDRRDPGLTLVIGTRNLSSWSLRPWLLLRYSGIPFEEVVIALDRPQTAARIRAHSAAGRVPVLHDGALTVWDSLAICEYLAERYGGAGLWPDDPAARAVARSISAEMHAGFAALRADLPMNILAPRTRADASPRAVADIARVRSIWRGCRTGYGAASDAGGPFLFGRFTVADAMFAPVATRFETYGVPLDGPERDYADMLTALPAMAEWREAAAAERDAA